MFNFFAVHLGQDETEFTEDEAFITISEKMETEAERTATVSIHQAIESLYPDNEIDKQMRTNIITTLNMTPFIITSFCVDMLVMKI